MSVWKSPISYIGIALVVSVAVLLGAPFIINWNSYRASIEEYGKKLTGREVAISGDISARIFPWPRLRLEGVRIANPPGAAIPDLVSAEAIEARMLLGSLISGYVEVSDIRIEKPVFALERLESGEGSWWLAPQRQGEISIGADRISVEDLEIVDGKIFLSDSRRGGTARFEDFDAVLSSQTLLGPWKARGELSSGGHRLSVGVSTGMHKPGEPFKFVVKLTPVDGPGLVYSFDGEYTAKGDTPVSGLLRVEPFVDGSGKSDSQAQMRSVTLKSRLAFKEDHALLQQIEIAPADREQPGNLLTGDAAIELQSRISVLADLRAPKFDLDQMLGNHGREVLKSGAVLESLSDFILAMPEGVDGRLILNVGSLTAGGETLESARIEAELAERGVVVHDLSATMPGQTKAKFSGLLFAGDEKPRLAGDLQVESASAREFVSWLMPEWKPSIADHWQGARGRLSLRSKVDYGPLNFSLTDTHFTLDDAAASGDVTLAGGDDAGRDIRLRIDKLDLDRYLPNGLGLSQIPGEALRRIVALGSDAGALGETRINVQADRVLLNAIEAHNVTVDVAAAEDSIEIRDVTIGQVGNARLEIGGRLEPGPQSSIGSIALKIDAADPRALLHLLGVVPPLELGEPEPSWAAELAPLKADIRADFDSRSAESQVKLEASGTAGGSNISLSSTFLGDLSNPHAGRLSLLGDITSPNAKKLAALFGIAGQKDEKDAARLTLSLDGEVRAGLQMEAELHAIGASGRFSGRLEDPFAASGPKADGRLTLQAPQSDRLLQALKILSPQPGAALRLQSKFSTGAGRTELADFEVWLGERRFVGRFLVDEGEIDLAARAAELSLPWLLSLALMPTDGRPLNDVTLFNRIPLGGARGRIVFDADRMLLAPGLPVSSGRTELEVRDGKLRLSLTGSGPRGTPFALKADLASEADELRAKGTVEGGLELSELLSAPDGEPVIDSLVTFKSNFSGAGRSPAGLAASLSGSGEMTMPNGFVRGIDAQSFIAGLSFSPTTAGVDRLLRQGFTGSDLIFSGGLGRVGIVDGIATFGPVAFESGGIKGRIKSIVELSSGKVDLSVEVGLKALGGIPPIEVAYSGPPDRLERSVDAGELKARLSAAELRQNMEQLEKLQREQMELFGEDDRQSTQQGRAKAEELRRLSEANRKRAEEEALRAKDEELRKAAEMALQLDRDELARRAEVMETWRRETRRRAERQRRAVEAAAERQELQRRAERAERRRQNELAARQRAEEERKAREAELERQRQAEEAARLKAEEERKAREAALRLEQELKRQAEEAERQRLAEEAAKLKAEEERKAREAEIERQRLAEEAERQRLAEEAARAKAEEERKAREAEIERQRLAEEAAKLKEEEERKAREAALKLEQELKRQAEEEERRRLAEEAERQRLAEEAARAKAEEERKAREAERERQRVLAALELERQRQAEEAERRREAERQLARNLALQTMNEREMIQQLQRSAVWKIDSQRARERAARRALEEAQAKIDRLLEEEGPTSTLVPSDRQERAQPITVPIDDPAQATESISLPIEDSMPGLPAAEPLPLDDDAASGPTAIDPGSTSGTAAKQTQLGDSADDSLIDGELPVDPQSIVPQGASEPSLLQRLERIIKAPPSHKREPTVKKRYNFNR